jgi:uncharacterized membrane protein
VAASKETIMNKCQTAIAVFPNRDGAEKAVKTLTAAGFEMKNLTVVGKGHHSEEKVTGFYNIGERVKFWGSRGVFWGGLWGLFFGGLFIATPLSAPVMLMGFLATMIISGVETAAVAGAAGVLGAALYSIGIPKNSVLQYDADIKADNLLVVARGPTDEVERAKVVLKEVDPCRSDIHETLPTAPELAHA